MPRRRASGRSTGRPAADCASAQDVIPSADATLTGKGSRYETARADRGRQVSLVATKRSLTEWWALVKKAALAWVDDYAPSMGAALSYYTVFSLAPMLLIVLAVAGL